MHGVTVTAVRLSPCELLQRALAATALPRMCAADRERLTRKVLPIDRLRGCLSVALLAQAAGAGTDAAPSAEFVCVPRSREGRPALQLICAGGGGGGSRGVATRPRLAAIADANVSHHGSWVCCAAATASVLGSSARVGVDLMELSSLLPSRDRLGAFRRYFSEREAAYIGTLPEPLYSLAFASLWGMKEAFAKVGCGRVSRRSSAHSLRSRTSRPALS